VNEVLLDKAIEGQLESLTLIPSGGGRFEVTVNDKLAYSKMTTGRHANRGEVVGLIKALLK
jgi:selenoprotein W-related protein